MSEEEKQALIERCETISAWRAKYGDLANVMLPAIEAQEIAKIALAALTAQPVKLAKDLKLSDKAHQSHCDYAEGYNDRAEMDRHAIRAAGYEVQE